MQILNNSWSLNYILSYDYAKSPNYLYADSVSHPTIPLCPSDQLLPLILCLYCKSMHWEAVPGKERDFRFLKHAGKPWQHRILGIQSTRSSTTDRRIINPLLSLKKYSRFMKFWTIYEILNFLDNPETQLSVCKDCVILTQSHYLNMIFLPLASSELIGQFKFTYWNIYYRYP